MGSFPCSLNPGIVSVEAFSDRNRHARMHFLMSAEAESRAKPGRTNRVALFLVDWEGCESPISRCGESDGI